MLDLESLIPSKDVRDCMAKNGMELSDIDKAAVIYNSWRDIGLGSLDEMFSELKEIAGTTKDVALKAQIKERLEFEDEQRGLFRENTEGFMYKLDAYEEEANGEGFLYKRDAYVAEANGKHCDTLGYFASEERAAEHIKNIGCGYSITKYPIVGLNGFDPKPQKYYYAAPDTPRHELCECFYYVEVASKHFNKNGDLVNFHSSEKSFENAKKVNHFDPSRFEGAAPNIPNPFDLGDIVSYKTVEEEIHGVVLETREEWESLNDAAQKGMNADWSDFSIEVYNLHNYEVYRNRVNPFYLESYEPQDGDEDLCVLYEISAMLKGESNLYMFLTYYDDWKKGGK